MMRSLLRKGFAKREHEKILFLPDYEYSPLEPGFNQIRILTLLPGEWSAPIQIRLNTVELDRGEWDPELSPTDSTQSSRPTAEATPKPVYEALSYAWGTTKELVTIWIVEDSSKFALKVTQSLATALPYLRYRNQTRALWIDAICVNQQDLYERSQQVQRMQDIYSMSGRVVVWLGPESNDSNLALSTLHAMSLEVEVDWMQVRLKPLPGRDPKSADHGTPVQYRDKGKTLRAITSLVQRPWFERLWIWQEVYLAGSNAVIQCGRKVIAWKQLCKSVACICVKSWRNESLDDLEENNFNQYVRRAFKIAYHSRSDLKFGLQRLSLDTSSCSCTDPKDRIFALLCMLDPDEAKVIEPDYSKSTNQIYMETFINIVGANHDLTLLRLCSIEKRIPDCPTWVPNFGDVPKVYELPHFFASGSYSDAEIDVIRKRILRVTGRKIDVVKGIVGCVPLGSRSIEVMKMIRGLNLVHTSALRSSPYIAGGSVLEACCRLISLNQFPERTDLKRDFLSFTEAIETFSEYLSMPEEQFESVALSLNASFIHSAGIGRKLVVTEEGYIGWTPEATEVGDEVCVLLGCNLIMILRPADDGFYQVVGESYMQGLMDSEALLGAVSKDWSVKFRNNGGYTYQSFVHLDTGEVTKTDPRLAGVPLPNGWEFTSHSDEEYFDLFNNTKTGRVTGQDPRSSSESLKSRGVDMQTFNLI